MPPRKTIPVRYRLLALMVTTGFINYLLRNNISVAIPSIREAFAFSATEIGWILGSFNVSYALFQIPGGAFAETIGYRRAMAVIASAWGLLTLLTGFVPGVMAASAAGAMTALIVVRFLMGVANAPTYPITVGLTARWFPVGSWGLPNALSSVGLTLGQAAIGPVVTMLILWFGWQSSFYALSPIGFLLAVGWYVYVRDRPADHPAMTARELALIERNREPAATAKPTPGSWREVLMRRDVLLLAASYFCMNYVFYMFAQWLFVYLVEERGFSLLESGFLYALPFVTGAALAACGGFVCDRLCRRFGGRLGCRIPAMLGLALVAVFQLAGIRAADPYVAVAFLSLCFGFTQFTEGAFASAATYAGGPHAATAYGAVNTGGNAAGFLAPLVGLMLDRLGWLPTLASGSLFALVGAALWLFIRLRGDSAPRLGRAQAAIP
jgi:ACS family glucarate transporter-like MFS transporter